MRFNDFFIHTSRLLGAGDFRGVILQQQDAAAVMSSASDPMILPSVRPLFGGSLGWNRSNVVWESVDDRVRGGSSTSHFVPVSPTERETTGEEGAAAGSGDAVFYGHLNTKTLGGAGFASCTSKFTDGSSFDLTAYEGILLSITEADEKKYTFIIKDEVPARRPDGRMESGVSFEYDLEGQAKSERQAPQEVRQIKIPWSNFTATYRGREVKHPDPLRTERILRFSVMARSFFDQQSGDFSLTLHGIDAYKASEEDGSTTSSDSSKSAL